MINLISYYTNITSIALKNSDKKTKDFPIKILLPPNPLPC